MKKLLIMATAIVAALTINAQTYDISTMAFVEADMTATNGTITNNADKGYFEVKNNEGETVVLTFAQLPNMEFSYKNSGSKIAFKVTPSKYIQFDGDQRDLTFKNLSVGDKIKLTVASKGGTPNSFEDSASKGTGLTGCILVDGNITQAAKGDALVFEDVTVQAIAATVVIRTTAGGYCLQKIVIEKGASAVNDVNVDAMQAKKVIRDGQLYIVRDGVYYNALGAEVR